MLTSDRVVSQLAAAADSIPVGEVLPLSNLPPTPLIEADMESSAAPIPCIVRRRGCIIGFCDVREAKSRAVRRYGSGIAASVKREARPGGAFLERRREISCRRSGPPCRTPAGRSRRSSPRRSHSIRRHRSWSRSCVASFPAHRSWCRYHRARRSTSSFNPKRGFALDGPAEGKLTVTGEDEGLPLQFKLRGTAPGPGQIRVLAFHAGRPLGMITLAPVVLESAGEVNATSMSREGALAPATVRIPDLSLLILETKDEGETLLSLRLTSANPALGYNLKLFGPTRLKSDPFAYFQSLFTDIERLPIQSAADKAKAEITLANMGATLFGDLMPDELKNILWTLRASITSVQVQSEEPWIPWELCKLVKHRPAAESRRVRSSARPFSSRDGFPGFLSFRKCG